MVFKAFRPFLLQKGEVSDTLISLDFRPLVFPCGSSRNSSLLDRLQKSAFVICRIFNIQSHHGKGCLPPPHDELNRLLSFFASLCHFFSGQKSDPNTRMHLGCWSHRKIQPISSYLRLIHQKRSDWTKQTFHYDPHRQPARSSHGPLMYSTLLSERRQAPQTEISLWGNR